MKNKYLTYVGWIINRFQGWKQNHKLASEAQNQSKIEKNKNLKYKDGITGKGKEQQQMKNSWVFISPLKMW